MDLKLMCLTSLAATALACDAEQSGDAGGTEGESDSAAIAAACESPDPDVDASFDLLLEGWDDSELPTYTEYSVDDDCMISSVDVVEGTWVTELDCSVEGEEEARTATLSMAALEARLPDWSAGDAAHLSGSSDRSSFGGHEHFELTRAEDLLVEGLRGDEGDLAPLESLTDPLEATASYDECGAPLPGDPETRIGKLALTFTVGEEQLFLISGHRGEVELVPGTSMEIDLERAESGHCCHANHSLEVLKRRTVPTP